MAISVLASIAWRAIMLIVVLGVRFQYPPLLHVPLVPHEFRKFLGRRSKHPDLHLIVRCQRRPEAGMTLINYDELKK